jgi:transposase
VAARAELFGRPAGAGVVGGIGARSAAKLFRISASYIYKALIRRRRTGEVSASARRGHRPRKLSPAQEAAMAVRIEAHPDLKLAALQAWLLAEHGVRLSNQTIWSAVARLGLSFKKTLRASEQDHPDVAARRRIWQTARPFVDADNLVFIDETSASTKMTRLYGRTPRGRRLFAKAPFGHWETPPSSPRCGATGSARRWCSIGR